MKDYIIGAAWHCFQLCLTFGHLCAYIDWTEEIVICKSTIISFFHLINVHNIYTIDLGLRYFLVCNYELLYVTPKETKKKNRKKMGNISLYEIGR